MSALSKELDGYLTIRRSLGFDLGTTERILRMFITFAEREDAAYISSALFLRWQETFGHANRQTWSLRLGIIRRFAQWLNGIDQKHEVPPQALIPSRYRRVPPYIYSDEEIRRIVETSATLLSINGIRPLTYSTLFGLIAVTGLRISEALSLDVADVDLDAGCLRFDMVNSERHVYYPSLTALRSDLSLMLKNGTGFLALHRNHFSYRITVNALPTVAPDTTSPLSARL